jgi:membrane-associated phospholipid phosphatase
MLLDSSAIFLAIMAVALVLGEKRNPKRLKIFLSVSLAILFGMVLKEAMAVERPCTGESFCPDNYAFPSLHATAAFAFMIGFLNKREFPLYLFFALFTAFTRMNLGVHTFTDIAGGLPVALVSYYIIDRLGVGNG